MVFAFVLAIGVVSSSLTTILMFLWLLVGSIGWSVISAGPEIICWCYRLIINKKLCSFQLSMEFILLINVKKPTVVGILTFMSRKNTTSKRTSFFSAF